MDTIEPTTCSRSAAASRRANPHGEDHSQFFLIELGTRVALLNAGGFMRALRLATLVVGSFALLATGCGEGSGTRKAPDASAVPEDSGSPDAGAQDAGTVIEPTDSGVPDSPPPVPDAGPVDPRPSLHVQVEGRGTVHMLGTGSTCDSDCVFRTDPGTYVAFAYRPAEGSAFVAWESSLCPAGEINCEFTAAEGENNVTAIFENLPDTHLSSFARTYGPEGWGFAAGLTQTSDAIYVCGVATGRFDFGSSSLISTGDAIAYVVKYSSWGEPLWASAIGTASTNEFSCDVQVTSAGGVSGQVAVAADVVVSSAPGTLVALLSQSTGTVTWNTTRWDFTNPSIAASRDGFVVGGTGSYTNSEGSVSPSVVLAAYNSSGIELSYHILQGGWLNGLAADPVVTGAILVAGSYSRTLSEAATGETVLHTTSLRRRGFLVGYSAPWIRASAVDFAATAGFDDASVDAVAFRDNKVYAAAVSTRAATASIDVIAYSTMPAVGRDLFSIALGAQLWSKRISVPQIEVPVLLSRAVSLSGADRIVDLEANLESVAIVTRPAGYIQTTRGDVGDVWHPGSFVVGLNEVDGYVLYAGSVQPGSPVDARAIGLSQAYSFATMCGAYSGEFPLLPGTPSRSETGAFIYSDDIRAH